MVYTLRFFSLQNAVCFIILTCLVPVLLKFYIQGMLKLKNNSGAKRLKQRFVPAIRSGLSLTPFVIGRDRRGKFTTLTYRNLFFLDSKFCETL
jgi:hypothetical protein